LSAFIESISRARAEFAARGGSLVADAALSARLETLQREGFAAFIERGLPTRRDERWKGTNVAALERLEIARVGSADAPSGADDARAVIAAHELRDLEADLIFLDGRVVRPGAERAPLADGVRILSLAEAAAEMPQLVTAHLGRLADAKQDAFTGLHDGCFEDVAVVVLAPGARVGRALRVLCIATAAAGDRPSASFPRVLVVAGEASEGDLLVESIASGDAPGFTCLVSELDLGAGARFGLVSLQAEGAERFHLAQTFAELERDACLHTHVLSTSEGFVRSEVTIGLQAPGATTRMQGLYVGRDDAHHDHFTTVDHAAPHCASDEEYRGVLSDRSSGVFRGRVIVRPGAQKTDARQSNPNLLLSDGASIDTKPQLEIYADDVKASHGSTIGQLDADALFFLRARGIDQAEARLLLTRGFARAIVDGIDDPQLRDLVDQRVETALLALDPEPPEEGNA
jgi:Fe-S cluster assembly protein SufD